MSRLYSVKAPLEVSGRDDYATAQALWDAMAATGANTSVTAPPSLSRPLAADRNLVTAYFEIVASNKAELQTQLLAALTAARKHGITAAGQPTILAIRAADQPQRGAASDDEVQG